jgi:hypothetical protein
MKYLKFTSYAYIIIALICIYEGITKWNDETAKPWLSFGIAAMAVFMFFFRAKYSKRFEDRNSNQ